MFGAALASQSEDHMLRFAVRIRDGSYVHSPGIRLNLFGVAGISTGDNQIFAVLSMLFADDAVDEFMRIRFKYKYVKLNTPPCTNYK